MHIHTQKRHNDKKKCMREEENCEDKPNKSKVEKRIYLTLSGVHADGVNSQ